MQSCLRGKMPVDLVVAVAVTGLVDLGEALVIIIPQVGIIINTVRIVPMVRIIVRMHSLVIILIDSSMGQEGLVAAVVVVLAVEVVVATDIIGRGKKELEIRNILVTHNLLLLLYGCIHTLISLCI